MIIVQFIAHSSRIRQPLDLCVFGLFRMLSKREAKTKRMNEDPVKMNRAILAFYKSILIPMVRWSFVRTGCRVNLKDLLARLTVIPSTVLDRIRLPEIRLEEYVFLEPTEAVQAAARAARQRLPIRRPSEFAVSLKACVDKVSGTCPLRGYTEKQDEEEDQQTD
jgi:hypothetical protein